MDSDDSNPSSPTHVNETEEVPSSNLNAPKAETFRKGQIGHAQLSLLKSGEGADLQITCCNRTWAVHKSILAQRSAWFRGALRGGFKEKSQDHLTLEEDDPEAVFEILKYLYTLSDHVDIEPLSHRGDEDLNGLASQVKYLISLIATADKYCVTDLVEIAGAKVHERLDIFCNQAKVPYIKFKLEYKEVVPGLVEALYSKKDHSPVLDQWQLLFARKLIDTFSSAVDVPDAQNLVTAYPRLGWNLLKSADKERLESRETILKLSRENRVMMDELPKSKRKRIYGY